MRTPVQYGSLLPQVLDKIIVENGYVEFCADAPFVVNGCGVFHASVSLVIMIILLQKIRLLRQAVKQLGCKTLASAFLSDICLG